MKTKTFKRYVLFAGDFYYPKGGTGDLVFASNSLEEIKLKRDKEECDWSEIVDLMDLKIIGD